MLVGQPYQGWKLCFNYTLVIRSSDLMTILLIDLSIDERVGPDALAVLRPTGI